MTLKAAISTFIRRIKNKVSTQPGKYFNLVLSEDQIKRNEYKAHLGGGADEWDKRGAFQLHFMKEMGMTEKDRFLDAGCGPGRGAKHIIDFLDAGKYYGFDYNQDFIKIARSMILAEKLEPKEATFEVVHDFNLSITDSKFDYALAFSVLNHCNEEQKQKFFQMLPNVMSENGRMFVTHCGWYENNPIAMDGSRIERVITEKEVDEKQFGWNSGKSIFPIFEIVLDRGN